MGVNDSFGFDPEPTHWPPNLRAKRGPQKHEDSSDTLHAMYSEMLRQGQDRPQGIDVLPQIGVTESQVLSQFNVPFAFNSITLSAVYGIVAVTFGAVQTTKDTVTGAAIVDGSLTPFNHLFGANAFLLGPGVVADFTPIEIFTGPQQITFQRQPPGPITFWIHQSTGMNIRKVALGGTISTPPSGGVLIVGSVNYIPGI